MNLVVFDLDGTLLRTGDVDRRCYSQSVVDVFGIRDPSTDWRDYTHVTDSGITREVVQRHLSREPSVDELGRVIRRFVELLSGEFGQNPDTFQPLPGAKEALELLPRASGWQVVIATGGWRASAEYKLKCADMPADGVLMGTADDAITREGIVEAAIDAARRRCGVSEFARIVSVGDGIWDLRTAAHMRLPFVGIGAAESLASIGAEWGVPDFGDYDGFVALLESSTAPVIGETAP